MNLSSIFQSSIEYLINFANQIGYFGIFVGMFLESTIVPIPSELVMIPAGISIANGGEMNLFFLIFCGVAGNVSGALFSYYFALLLGKKILLKIGRFFFIKPQAIDKVENFFQKHGSISIFIGRMIPGVRHFISIPAGIASMNVKLFTLYTFAGSMIWTSVLTFCGYLIGSNQKLIKEYLEIITLIFLAICFLLATFYIFLKSTKK
jgi:membrane protein DedA with SNARE-associated domain